MVSFSVKVVDDENKPVSNATVVSKQDIWFSSDTKETESITDNNGIVFFDGVVLYLLNKASSKSVPTVKVPKVNLK